MRLSPWHRRLCALEGIDDDEARDWEALLGFHPVLWLHWRRSGFYPRAAHDWGVVGGFEARAARRWYSVSLNREDALYWLPTGLQPSVASEFQWSGFSRKQALRWHGVDFDAKTARAWKDWGWDAPDAASWRERGYTAKDARIEFSC